MLKWTVIGFVLMMVAGFGSYYVWMTLPAELRAKVAGWKTNTVAAVVAFAPDLITLLSYIQSTQDQWAPSPEVNIAFKVVGGLMIALRFITSREQKEDL